MATNQQAIHDLVAAKAAFEAQVAGGASGLVLTELMDSISVIEDEVGQLVLRALSAVYVPQTDPFKAATGDAKAFVRTLKKISVVFGAVSQVVIAVSNVLRHVI